MVLVTTTKLDGETKYKFEKNPEKKEKIFNYDVVVLKYGSVNYACFEHNDVWVSVTSTGISEERFLTMLYLVLKLNQ